MLNVPRFVSSTIVCSYFVLAHGTPALANDDIQPSELINLSLEQLSNIEVTSVSKKSEKASETAAAIYVITQDDIRRSGMTSIPELLRMVPGLDVAQAGAHDWAITSRGSNGQFSNKLLVLIDGRTVYTSIFSGVFWDVQDTPLQDIDRIEVIRGPGATLWGANAVNGVINIITKSAKDTQGGFVSESIGNKMNTETTARYGVKTDGDGYIRAYAKYDDDGSFKQPNGLSLQDSWTKAQGGFRSDWKNSDSQSFTFQGDAYSTNENTLYNLPLPASTTSFNSALNVENDVGGNILGRWNDKISKDSDLTLQMYYDDEKRSNIFYYENTQTLDIDLQHVWTALQGQEIVWGAGYRLVDTDTRPTLYLFYTPPHRDDSVFNSFIQDKITLHPNDVFLTLGSKFEHNDFTGFAVEPSARLSWLVDDKQTLWTAVSHAVRTPDVGEEGIQVYAGTLATNTIGVRIGVPGTESEEVTAYEAGYRVQPVSNVSLDVATFYNSYNRLILGVQGSSYMTTTALGTYNVVQVLPGNVGTADSYGIEPSIKWNPTSYMELAASYTLLELKFNQPDPYGFSFANKAPKQEFNVRSAVQLPHDVEFDTSVYTVGSIAPAGSIPIDSYTRLDTKLAWKPLNNVEVSLVGQNLLQSEHREFSGFLYQDEAEIPRTFYGNITWKF